MCETHQLSLWLKAPLLMVEVSILLPVFYIKLVGVFGGDKKNQQSVESLAKLVSSEIDFETAFT